ncbi:PilC/PilY family type IV pilus protein [Pseudomonas benzenivorans]|uniref:Pilus assembly protein PilY n=1 Tax=Pseudomonas benzenivorans TaxID=556533 RepID=A0ABY5H309_9PSED|nr:PilC/PilY family type IV pilus protein [Pseudomonas benzenivorans]UTW06688.1 pilus assembly protein PilY [Pseudomonas benzenivorans]
MTKRAPALHRMALSAFASLLVLHSAVSFADDTEIFFGGAAISSDVRPNVLFVLDNSGSMAWSTTDQSVPNEPGEQSRMQVLKDSFSTIINQSGAINAGIMVLNPRSEYNDTRMVYPVTNIDSPLPGSVKQIAGNPQMLSSGDDATQWSNATTAVIDEPTLPIGKFEVSGSSTKSYTLARADAFLNKDNHSCLLDASLASSRPGGTPCVGINQSQLKLTDKNAGTALMYFSGLGIPASSTVNSATLTIYPVLSQINPLKPQVSVERSKNAMPPNDNTSITGRTFSAWRSLPDAAWNPLNPVTLDITQEVNGLRGLPHTNSAVENLVLQLLGNQDENHIICMKVGIGCTIDKLPVLRITSTSSSPSSRTRSAALRFQNVAIPQGATITSAYLNFVPVAANSDPLTLQVRAENTGSASTFSNTTNLSGRGKLPAVVTWNAPSWGPSNPPTHLQGPDVTSLVQGVVNLGNWCGNNSLAIHLEHLSGNGSRTAYSFDAAPSLQPTLTISYTGGTGGCLNPIIEATVSSPKNDAYEKRDGSMVLGDATLPVKRSRFAARFEDIPLTKGAKIMSVEAFLTPTKTESSPNISTVLRFENADNSLPFTSSNRNITNRSDTPNSTCLISSWVAGSPVICKSDELKQGLQAVVDRPGWAPGNAITLMSVQNADTNLEVKAYESNPAQALKLRIKLESGGLATSTYTVRQHLNDLVQAMDARNGTPLVPTYYDAAQYLRGERSGFTSPITSACQSTHLVLLTDGQANGSSSSSTGGIEGWTGTDCKDDASDSDEQCGRTLATWLAANDQSSISGDNFITTHTIGFALGAMAPNTKPQAFLNDLAANGKGKAHTAENASQLSAAFSQILQDVLKTDTTFVSPGATVNQFNRSSNKNEVYFALFKPSETDRWAGNLKRYALNSGTGDIILDADNVGAIDKSTGFFEPTARSFWSIGNDGNNTAQGGAAGRLPAHTSRKAYTYLGNSPITPASLTTGGNLLIDGNATITKEMLGAADATERTALINWIRGLNDDGSSRSVLGDPLHSAPRLVTYKCNNFTDTDLTRCASEEQSVLVGTNEGFVHAFDTKTGDEQMAFMPQELLTNIKKLKVNDRTGTPPGRPYGMDNTLALWVNDVNRNGVIYGGRDPSKSTPTLLPGSLNSGEFVYAYATMGRGGRNLYALDITDVNNPKMRWFITPSTFGFQRLGQTWSAPVVTKIKIGSTETPILIFAGGYDDNQDDISSLERLKKGNLLSPDTHGNALYVVNALTGALIWTGSSDKSLINLPIGAQHQELEKMRYSIPSSVRVIDIDRDGLADQFFVGDMGGQVWRFFINNGNGITDLIAPANTGGNTKENGVFASVIPPDTGSETTAQKEAKLRRFYNEPDIALLTVNAGKALVVNIGSGYRGHPLDIGAEDRFYSFRTPIIGSNTVHTTLTEADMYDATLNLIQEGTATQKAAAAAAFNKKTGGWYIRLERPGEKVLSEATTFAGQVFFNTYEPSSNSANNTCKAVQGTGRSYAVSLFDATPPQQRIVGSPDRADRSIILLTAGIPPKGTVLFPEGADKPPLCIGTECEELEVDISVGPTYWIDER